MKTNEFEEAEERTYELFPMPKSATDLSNRDKVSKLISRTNNLDIFKIQDETKN